MAYGGVKKPHAALLVPISSLTRSGYPVINHTVSFHRKMIRKGDHKADALVKCFLAEPCLR